MLAGRPRPLQLRGTECRRPADHARWSSRMASGRRPTGPVRSSMCRAAWARSVPSTAPQSIGALASPHSTVEELHLLGKLVRGLGSENIDHRLRHRDFSAAPAGSARWLGGPIADLSNVQQALVIGSFLRKDHPLFAQRLRQACKHGAQIHRLNALEDDWAMPVATSITVEPSRWVAELAGIAAALAAASGVAAPVAVEPGESRTRGRQGAGRWRQPVDPARQCGRAASAGGPAAGAGRLDRRAHRCPRRLPRRGIEQCRRSAGRGAAGRGRARHRRACSTAG